MELWCFCFMDKSWVWLSRLSIEYEQGASNFVYESAKSLGNPLEMFCPCIDCRNMCHKPIEIVLEHLVIRGMDQKYKRKSCWIHHGDIRNDRTDDEMGSTAKTSLREDVVSQVLGKYKHGRLGRGVTATKLAFLQRRDSHVETLQATQAELQRQIQDLKNVVTDLARKKKQRVNGSNSGASDVSKGVRCQLLDWNSHEDVVVGEGEYCSVDPSYKIGRIPLGPHAAAVIVKGVYVEVAYVWRPTETIILLGQALGLKIAWPAEKIILDEAIDTPDENYTEEPSAAHEPKVHIFDWNMEDAIIGEGRLFSTDPKEMVNNIPIGPKAAIVTVEKVFTKDAFLWRPTAEILTLGDALHENIVWPIQNVQLVSSSESEKAPQKTSSPLVKF